MKIIFALVAATTLTACMREAPISASRRAAIQQEQVSQRAQAEVGIYTPTNFTRKRLANKIGELLDNPNLATLSYAQGLDGKLRCIGHTIGFPLPGAVQTTSPMKWESRPGYIREGISSYEQVPQSEPDQLFYPSGMDATWLMLVGKNGQAAPAYFEGKVQTFLPNNKPDPSLIAQDCTS